MSDILNYAQQKTKSVIFVFCLAPCGLRASMALVAALQEAA